MPGAYLWGWDDTNSTWVKCRVTAAGKLIINPTGFLENPPTEDEAKKAPTSEWAYDHWKNASAHHAKYTDAESRAAIGDIFDSDGQLIDTLYASRESLVNMESIQFSGQQTGPGYGYMFYKSSAAALRMYGKNLAGNNIDLDFQLYQTDHYVKVIHDESFQAALALYLESTPSNGVVNKAPTSDWAYDHENDASAHHTKYTDLDAVDSFVSRETTMYDGTHDSWNASSYSMINLDDSGGNIDIRGLAGGYTGKIIFFIRGTSSNTVTIRNENANPTAANRIVTYSGGDYVLGAGKNGGFILIYRNSRWRMLYAL